VDNGSTDGSIDFVKSHYPEVEILAFKNNQGFAPAVNAGIKQAHSPYVALLNADTIPKPDWLSHLVNTIKKCSRIGCVASKMLNLNKPTIIDDAGDTFSWYGSARKRGQGEPAERYEYMQEVLSACAGAALYRRSILTKIGGFDETFVSYLEDIDVGIRMRLHGYCCLYAPKAIILHQGHGANLTRARYVYFMTRNRLAVLTKNIPLTLLRKHWRTLSYGQLYFFLVYKHPIHSIAGTIAWLIDLPHLLRKRKEIQRKRVITDEALEESISNDLGEIPLRKIITDKLRGIS
jgi:GT2 family glycosyltransferase